MWGILKYTLFWGGEYEWQGTKVDTLGLTHAAFQSQAKVIHVDFENSGLEELFLLFGNYQMEKTPRTKIFVFLLFSSTLKLWDYSKGKVKIYAHSVDLTKLIGKSGFHMCFLNLLNIIQML